MIISQWFLPQRKRHRVGASSLDLLVSFTLLLTAVSVATPLVVRHGRVLKSQRNYRLALDELSNQLERLTTLPADELPGAIKDLSPSPFLTDRVPNARLTGELQPAEQGTRVTLKLSWNDGQRQDAPVTLAAWMFPVGKDSSAAREGEMP